MRYLLPGVILNSEFILEEFSDFAIEDSSSLDLPEISLKMTDEEPLPDVIRVFSHAQINISELESGWLFSSVSEREKLLVSEDYRELVAWVKDKSNLTQLKINLLRTALECASVANGIVSFHSACVEADGYAVAFTGKSGTGKSTRANAWIENLGYSFVSGDRPAIFSENGVLIVSGVPWDGKERIYRNIRLPLKAILDVHRSDNEFFEIRELTQKQKLRVLMQQAFIPMWDTKTASVAIAVLHALSRKAPMLRLFCGPDGESAKRTHDVLFNHPELIKEARPEMKVKDGFTLRNVIGENILMPTGDNIGKFDGTVIFNEVSAFVWEKMQTPVSREDLLGAILGEFEVDKETAEKDLDALIEKFSSLGLIDENATD